MRYILLAGLSVVSVFNAQAKILYGDIRLTEVKPTNAQVYWKPDAEHKSRYPVPLARKGIAGCAIFKVNLDAQGNTESVVLLHGIPATSLSRPGKKILKKWPWSMTSDTAPQAEEKIVRLDFCLGGQSVEEAQARCKVQASLNCEA